MAEIGLTGCDTGVSYFLPRSVDTSNTAEMLGMSPMELRMSKEGLNWSSGAGGLDVVAGMGGGGKAFMEKRPAVYNDD